MNKKALIVITVLLILGGLIYFSWQNRKTDQDLADQIQVIDLVTEFGKKLQMVPLTASKEIASQAIKDNYSDFVSPELLASWEQDPTTAPGRLTSSPWPDRIEITLIEKNEENSYMVEAKVIEITSAELVSGGAAATYPVTIKVQKIDGKWLITSFKKEDTEEILEASTTSISQTDNFYNIQAKYPQFKGVESSFNQKISDLITEQIEIFKKNGKDNWEARRATASPDNPVPENPPVPFDFITTWTPIQINNKYISFVIDTYYFSGGAHGITQLDAFNYDVEKKKEITILDFLGSSPQGLENLSKLTLETATAELESVGLQIDNNIKEMIEQGTEPTTDNYKNFNFSDGSLIIYFQQYQIAPGYLGPVPITLYKDRLLDSYIISDYLK